MYNVYNKCTNTFEVVLRFARIFASGSAAGRIFNVGGRPRHAMLRRLASRLEEEAAQEGTRRTPETQAVVRAAVASAAASNDGKPLLAEARRIAQPQLQRIRRAPDEIDGAPSS